MIIIATLVVNTIAEESSGVDDKPHNYVDGNHRPMSMGITELCRWESYNCVNGN